MGVTVVDLGFEQSSLILHDFDGELRTTTDAEDQLETDLIDAAERIVCLKRVNAFDVYEFAREVDKSRKTVSKHLDRMADDGILIRWGGGKGAGNKVQYRFPPEWVEFRKGMGIELTPHDQVTS
jgi:DNA-binding transcriptional ArsR family regulator